MKTVNFADVTVCGKQYGQAVEVGAGVQWAEVVPGLIERGLYTTYGTSMSVGTTGGFMQVRVRVRVRVRVKRSG